MWTRMRGSTTQPRRAKWTFIAATTIAAGCATGAQDSQPDPDGAGGEGGAETSGPSGPSTSSTSSTSSGAGGSLGQGGGEACGTDLDRAGCTCSPEDAPRACYTGPAEQAGKGVCVMGTQQCIPDESSEISLGAWGPCTGAGQPGPSACDGSDQDCNGMPDPPCGCMEGATQPCSTPCGNGMEVCIGGSWVDCTAPQPNPDASCPMPNACIPGAPPAGPWEAYDFAYHPAPTSCNGSRYARYDPGHALWVGAILCNASRYKLFLSPTKDGTYYQIGDFAGHGQDHCELVNAAFSIPNEDDIKSGGCASCDVGPLVFSDPALGPGWSRAHFGDCFTFEASWPQFNLHSTQWYECGVTIP